MKKIIIVFIVGLVFLCGTYTNSEPQITLKNKKPDNVTVMNIIDFIPEGYSVLDSVSGDLNRDDFLDIILVLKKNNENETSYIVEHPEKRPLYIFLGDKNGAFHFATKNDNAVYCVDCGGMMGDPYVGIKIEKGNFTVDHYGGSAWRWFVKTTFNYSESYDSWNLYKEESGSFHASKPDDVKKEVLTKKDFGFIPFEKYNIYSHK